MVHQFLLSLCTTPGTGVCFRDKGWYPASTGDDDELHDADDDDDSHSARRSGRVHNPLLASLIKSLKVNEDARQQELALKIFRACPELVQGSVLSH